MSKELKYVIVPSNCETLLTAGEKHKVRDIFQGLDGRVFFEFYIPKYKMWGYACLNNSLHLDGHNFIPVYEEIDEPTDKAKTKSKLAYLLIVLALIGIIGFFIVKSCSAPAGRPSYATERYIETEYKSIEKLVEL